MDSGDCGLTLCLAARCTGGRTRDRPDPSNIHLEVGHVERLQETLAQRSLRRLARLEGQEAREQRVPALVASIFPVYAAQRGQELLAGQNTRRPRAAHKEFPFEDARCEYG